MVVSVFSSVRPSGSKTEYDMWTNKTVWKVEDPNISCQNKFFMFLIPTEISYLNVLIVIPTESCYLCFKLFVIPKSFMIFFFKNVHLAWRYSFGLEGAWPKVVPLMKPWPWPCIALRSCPPTTCGCTGRWEWASWKDAMIVSLVVTEKLVSQFVPFKQKQVCSEWLSKTRFICSWSVFTAVWYVHFLIKVQ